MDEIKRPKIAVIGIGNTGASVVDFLSKDLNQENIKLIIVDHYNSLKFDKNPKITNIGLMYFTYKNVSAQDVSLYLDNPVCNKEEILELLSLVQDGDEIYYMSEWLGCLGGNHFQFKITRDEKTIMKTNLFKK